ncbi:hypothetical protein Plhal304r1_c003g0011761 [Plasmopara halstedii]
MYRFFVIGKPRQSLYMLSLDKGVLHVSDLAARLNFVSHSNDKMMGLSTTFQGMTESSKSGIPYALFSI